MTLQTRSPDQPTARSQVRATYQLCATLHPAAGGSADLLLAAASQAVLDSFAAETSAASPVEHSLQTVSVPEDGLWSARLARPAGSTVEVALLRGADCVRVGCRTLGSLVAPNGGGRAPLDRPAVVNALAATFELREERALDGRPWHVANSDDVALLLELVTSERRMLPVHLLTEPPHGRPGIQGHPFLLDADLLARRTLGAAYVVTLPMKLGFEWTALVTKQWSAYLGAVRTYWPGVKLDEGSPYAHPLRMADSVLSSRVGELVAEDAYTQMLVEQSYRHCATARFAWGDLRFLDDALLRRAELARVSAPDDSARTTLLASEVEALGEKVVRLEAERELALTLAADAEAARVELEDELVRLRGQLDQLRRAYVRKTGVEPDALVRFPASYAEVEEWVRMNLAGRLVLHPRAVRGLRDGSFEDVALVGRALLLLAREYRDVQLGEAGANDAFTAAYERLGLRFGRSIARERAGEEGETYFVRLGPADSERRFLEWHLRRGGDKDARFCLAIYFFWDDGTRQVVVGWLPSHLDNRMT